MIKPAAIVTAMFALLAFIPFTWLAYTNRDLPQFGKYQDDGLFVIGAKSLHDGHGYRISSLPGKPFQTKYQPLYPVLLAALWTLNGDFPHNLEWITLLQWTIIATFLTTAYLLIRSLGFEPWKAAAMMAFLAINPWLIYWALLPITDLLFAALVCAVYWLLRTKPHWSWTIGFIGAAAYFTKVAGVLIVPAILLGCLLTDRNWKRAVVICTPILAAFLSWTAWTQSHRMASDQSIIWYYTDYLGFHVKNGGITALPSILQSNLLAFVMTTGESILFNLGEHMFGTYLAVVILAAAISGTGRLIKRTQEIGYPIFCALHLSLILCWNFSPNVRLASPLMPLVAMGLWEEGVHVAGLIRRSIDSKKSGDRIIAQVFRTAVFGGLVCAAYMNVHFIFRGLPALIESDRIALNAERPVLEWCQKSLPANAFVLANHDTLFHLATGLNGLRAVPNSIAFYTNDESRKLEPFNHLEAFEDRLALTHILVTPNDFGDFEPNQREMIKHSLLSNPRHKQVYSLNGTTVLEIERPYLNSMVSKRPD